MTLGITQDNAVLCAANAVRLVQGLPLVPRPADPKKAGGHGLPIGAYPIRIHVGHGKGAYLYWTDLMDGKPLMACCCKPCGGGFPFCPPPCCWLCLGAGSPTMCGYCCGPAEGEGAAIHAGHGMPEFAKAMGMKGMGKGPYLSSSSTPLPAAAVAPQEMDRGMAEYSRSSHVHP